MAEVVDSAAAPNADGEPRPSQGVPRLATNKLSSPMSYIWKSLSPRSKRAKYARTRKDSGRIIGLGTTESGKFDVRVLGSKQRKLLGLPTLGVGNGLKIFGDYTNPDGVPRTARLVDLASMGVGAAISGQ